MEVGLQMVRGHFEIWNHISNWIYDLLRVLFYFRICQYIIIVVNVTELMVY
jgi:hypothetical protein